MENVTSVVPQVRQSEDHYAPFLAYVGDKGQYYLHTLLKMEAADPTLKRLVATWCWPALLITWPWLFYRKLYLVAILTSGLPLALDVLIRKMGWGAGLVDWLPSVAGVCFAILGRQLYIKHALRKIGKLRTISTSEAELIERARQAGGVNLTAAIWAPFALAVAYFLALRWIP
ncbi:DUF2628 domain-containing protein [Microvirga rosea]|uniref:DUF2628 domain-containing protein n=1 Tax=Microvirga rosea TaxID=2715425 RepID=UPI001D0BDB50|nr:DUF2628 domain-containing protein [Microvirga rosea]MCB8822883.1 DUF2628 domain-containing protein [Microvirga rosea]